MRRPTFSPPSVRRLLPVLLVAAALAGCNGAGSPGAATTAPPAPPIQASNGPVRVAALLPLSGPAASLGLAMRNAIGLALNGGPVVLDAVDTGGNPTRAAAAASAAIAGHDAIILGPLTSAETRAVAPIATAAGVPVLAWTSDPAAGAPGVWPLGLTPAQQVDRLLEATAGDGRHQYAAFLPENALGDAMASALTAGLAAAGAPPPVIARHDASFSSINDGLKTLSAFPSRSASAKADAAATAPGGATPPTSGSPGTPPASVQAASPAPATPGPAAAAPGSGKAPPSPATGVAGNAAGATTPAAAAAVLPPPPFDALLLADTGTSLQEIIDLLGPYDVHASSVRVLGPALWSAFARKLGPLAGAWYAAPDPGARSGFVARYAARYGRSPPGLADVAFDSAALAGALASEGGGITIDRLTRPDGFAGTDGVFALEPDGRVRRGLAVFEINPGGGARVVSPAPARLAPAS